MEKNISKFGYKVSLITAILTIVTFAIAVMTPPLSGPFCKADCFQYPFTDIASRFPRDYYWMYFAMILMIVYLIMMITIHQTVANEKKHFSLISVSL
jgi:polyferredoxin